MHRLLLCAWLIAQTLRPAFGQLAQSSNGSAIPIWGLSTLIQGGTSPLCNGSLSSANGTGLYSFNPNVAQGPQAGQPDNFSGKTLASSLAVTLQNPGFDSGNTSSYSSSYTLWYNTNGANYSDRYALGYDVCALVGFSLNYNTQLRGQSDNGSCQSTLDQPCISALTSLAEQWALWLTTPSPGPNSNLTSTSLPSVCRALSHAIVQHFPDECSYFFADKLDGIAYPLTSYGPNQYQTGLTSNCTINGTYQNTLTFYNNDSENVYNAWADSVTPVIGVWMPIADAGAQTSITEAVAGLFCGHIQNIKEDSFHPPALPSPTAIAYNTTTSSNSTTNSTTASPSSSASLLPASTPSTTNNGLSGGAIAGIVVGVVVGIALIAGAVFFLLWRKRKTPVEKQPMAEVPGQNARYEMAGDSSMAQLPANVREGGKYRAPTWELDAKDAHNPVELAGS